MYSEYRTARRLPPLPKESDIPDDERADFERALNKVRKYSEGNAVSDARPDVDGQPYAKPYWSAFANAPRAMMRLDDVLYKGLYNSQATVGGFSAADHEMIDLVLGFDSGYWGLHAGHVPNAITAGIRPEAIQALAEGREGDLTADESLQVEFIRKVRDGGMTDAIWQAMVERVGSVKGTIEFALFVCTLFTHHRMMWAMGVPAFDIEDFNEMMRGLLDRTLDVSAGSQDILKATMKGTNYAHIAELYS